MNTHRRPTDGPPRALVVNAGTHPEPYHLAIGLAGAGWGVDYVTGSQIRDSAVLRMTNRLLPKRFRSLIGPRLIKRDAAKRLKIRTASIQLEIKYQALKRITPHRAGGALEERTQKISAKAAKMLQAKHRRYDYVIAQHTCALDSFLAAPHATRVLLQPILDTQSLRDVLKEEALINPSWSTAIPEIESDSVQREEIERADLVVAGSEFVARKIRERYKKPTIVAHYGISFHSNDESTRTNRPDRHPLRVLFAGQVNQRKGIGYLIEAMEPLTDVAHLRIAGDVSEYVRARTGDRSNIEFLGALSRDALQAEYLRSDVLVLPSLGEGFALVALEAMATGLPCVVTEHTGVHEVIEHDRNGYVIPIRDARAISNLLTELSEDQERLRLASRHARATAEQLTWARFQGVAVSRILENWDSCSREPDRG